MFISEKCFRSTKGLKSWHTETKGPCPVRIKVGLTKSTSILLCLNSLTTLPEGVIYTNIWP